MAFSPAQTFAVQLLVLGVLVLREAFAVELDLRHLARRQVEFPYSSGMGGFPSPQAGQSPEMAAMQRHMMEQMEKTVQEKMMKKFTTDLEEKLAGGGSSPPSNMSPNPNGGFTLNIGNRKVPQTPASPPSVNLNHSPPDMPAGANPYQSANGLDHSSWNPPVKQIYYPSGASPAQSGPMSGSPPNPYVPQYPEPPPPSSGPVSGASRPVQLPYSGPNNHASPGSHPVSPAELPSEEYPRATEVPTYYVSEESRFTDPPAYEESTVAAVESGVGETGSKPAGYFGRHREATDVLPKGPVSDSAVRDGSGKDRQSRMLTSSQQGSVRTRYHYF